jgi:general secretion pathway protein F
MISSGTRNSGSSAIHAPVPGSVRLKVRGADGLPQIVEYHAISEAEASRRAAARGFRVLALESIGGPDMVAGTTNLLPSTARIQFPLLLFSQELLALLDAGLNLMEALATLHAKERQPAVRSVLELLLRLLSEGRNFSDALSTYPYCFPDIYVASVRASERTGDLPAALIRYIGYQQQFDAIRKKVISALIYPAMLLVVGGFVTLFLLGYVVPRFSAVYEMSGREMAWLSIVLLSFGNVINTYWPIILAAGSIAGVMLLAIALSPEGRARVMAMILRLPLLANKANEFRLSRFYRAVSLLLVSGIALPRALNMAQGMLSPAQGLRLVQCRLAVEQGLNLSTALSDAALSGPIAESLVKVGERSGQMAEMLERIARFHDEDLSRWLDWASRLLEPVLMAIIGLVVGTVVVLMYMPIFDLAGSLQ